MLQHDEEHVISFEDGGLSLPRGQLAAPFTKLRYRNGKLSLSGRLSYTPWDERNHERKHQQVSLFELRTFRLSWISEPTGIYQYQEELYLSRRGGFLKSLDQAVFHCGRNL